MKNKASLKQADSDKANVTNGEAGKANAEYVWKQLEDVVVPQLRLSVSERAVYFHLLRHSRLEGKLRYRFSIASLGRGTRLSATGIRAAMRRLVHQGALRLVQRSKAGHVVEVRVPDEVFQEFRLSGACAAADIKMLIAGFLGQRKSCIPANQVAE